MVQCILKCPLTYHWDDSTSFNDDDEWSGFAQDSVFSVDSTVHNYSNDKQDELLMKW